MSGKQGGSTCIDDAFASNWGPGVGVEIMGRNKVRLRARPMDRQGVEPAVKLLHNAARLAGKRGGVAGRPHPFGIVKKSRGGLDCSFQLGAPGLRPTPQ
jgi:hypothetical protein